MSFLKDHTGQDSSMRLMCLISLLAAILFGYIMVSGKGGSDGMMIVMAFLLGAFAPKSLQKAIEMKMPVKPA